MQPTSMPTNKVTAGAIAGAVMLILAYISKVITGVEMPAEVAMAGVTIITFAVQWFVPDAPAAAAPTPAPKPEPAPAFAPTVIETPPEPMTPEQAARLLALAAQALAKGRA